MLCWGANADGQLGSGGLEDNVIPAPVIGIGPSSVPSGGAWYSVWLVVLLASLGARWSGTRAAQVTRAGEARTAGWGADSRG